MLKSKQRSSGSFGARTLGQFEKEDLITRLLIIRMLCYVMPFALAVTMLGIRQFWLTGRTLQPKS